MSNAKAIEYGVGISKLTRISNNGELFKKETAPPAAIDFYIESSKPFSPYFHILFLDHSATERAIPVIGLKYKFGGNESMVEAQLA